MKRKSITIVLALAVIIMGSYGFNEIWHKNERTLRAQVKKEKIERIINLTEYTKFEWDILYEFCAYVSKERVEAVIGCEFLGFKETDRGDMNQIIFMKDGKVVCYVHGYPFKRGYGFDKILKHTNDEIYVKLLAKDNPRFKIMIFKKYKMLEYIS